MSLSAKFKTWMAEHKEKSRLQDIENNVLHMKKLIKSAVSWMGNEADNIAYKKLEECMGNKYFSSHFNPQEHLLEGRNTKRVNGEQRVLYLEAVTPLHVAAASGSLLCVNILLRMGFDPNTEDAHGKRAVDYLIVPRFVDNDTYAAYFKKLNGQNEQSKKLKM